jgi:glycosyltransferase involved in cell wall biosynthesis
LTAFSIVLPVRNGWPYVKECVESILQQTYPHFELVVLDNQSTDNTVPWLRTLKDQRIRIHTSQASLSIVDSWARVKDIEKKEYVTIIGHDDTLDPDFLAVIKGLIEQRPESALYLTGARLINSEGEVIRSCRPTPREETAAQYLKARFTNERDIFGTGYVMRSAEYDRVGGIPPFERLFFADDALWLSLLSGSRKTADPTEHFSVRIHPNSESASLPSSWSSNLIGLNQFAEFLDGYLPNDAEARKVAAEYKDQFMLDRHRSMFMYALIEASQERRKINPADVDRIEASLARNAPSVASALRQSPTVVAIAMLNSSPLRASVPVLWQAYNRLKSREMFRS